MDRGKDRKRNNDSENDHERNVDRTETKEISNPEKGEKKRPFAEISNRDKEKEQNRENNIREEIVVPKYESNLTVSKEELKIEEAYKRMDITQSSPMQISTIIKREPVATPPPFIKSEPLEGGPSFCGTTPSPVLPFSVKVPSTKEKEVVGLPAFLRSSLAYPLAPFQLPDRIAKPPVMTYQGTLLKGGLKMCSVVGHAHHSINLPELLNITRRIEATRFVNAVLGGGLKYDIVYVLPREEDSNAYCQFVDYLSSRNKVGIAGHEFETFFIVPPLPQLLDVLSVEKVMCVLVPH